MVLHNMTLARVSLVLPFLFFVSATAGDLSLYEAIRTGDIKHVREQLAGGAWPVNDPIDAPTGTINALRAAIYDREEEIALLLIEQGADLEASGVGIHTIASEGLADLLADVLWAAKRTPSPVDTGLVAASSNGYYQVVSRLLTADIFGSSSYWAGELERALGIANLTGHADIARLLLKHGADPTHEEAIFSAARFGSPGMVRSLIDAGADPDASIDRAVRSPHHTPLEWAIERYENGAPIQRYLASYIIPERTGEPPPSVSTRNLNEDLGRAEAGLERLLLAARLGMYRIVDESLGSTKTEDLELIGRTALEYGNDDIARIVIENANEVPLHLLSAVVRYSSPGMVRTALEKTDSTSDPERDDKLVQAWRERMSDPYTTGDGPRVLHELVRGGVDVCELRKYESEIDDISRIFLVDSATSCWDTSSPD